LDERVRNKHLLLEGNAYVTYVPIPPPLLASLEVDYPNLSPSFKEQLFIRQDFQVNPQAKKELEKERKRKLHNKRQQKQQEEEKEEKEEKEEDTTKENAKWERAIYYLSPALSNTLVAERLASKYQIVAGGVKVFDKVVGRRAIRASMSLEAGLADCHLERQQKKEDEEGTLSQKKGGELNGVKYEDGVAWRVRQEGIAPLLQAHEQALYGNHDNSSIEPFSVVRVSNPQDFFLLLSQSEETVDLANMHLEDRDYIMEQFAPISLRAFIFLFDPQADGPVTHRARDQFYLSCWKASDTKVSVNVKRQILSGIKDDFMLVYTPKEEHTL
jgi:hypothetical protein